MKNSLLHHLSSWIKGDIDYILVKLLAVPDWLVESSNGDLGAFFHSYRYHNVPLPTHVAKEPLLDRIHDGVLNVSRRSQNQGWEVSYLPEKVSPDEVLQFLTDIGFSVSRIG
jgi:hypothetical protein